MEQPMEQPIVQQWGFSVAQKAEVWARWRAGESVTEISRALGKLVGSVFAVLAVQGGVARAPRRRAPHALSEAEREQISRGVAAARSIRAIARELGRPA